MDLMIDLLLNDMETALIFQEVRNEFYRKMDGLIQKVVYYTVQ